MHNLNLNNLITNETTKAKYIINGSLTKRPEPRIFDYQLNFGYNIELNKLQRGILENQLFTIVEKLKPFVSFVRIDANFIKIAFKPELLILTSLDEFNAIAKDIDDDNLLVKIIKVLLQDAENMQTDIYANLIHNNTTFEQEFENFIKNEMDMWPSGDFHKSLNIDDTNLTLDTKTIIDGNYVDNWLLVRMINQLHFDNIKIEASAAAKQVRIIARNETGPTSLDDLFN